MHCVVVIFGQKNGKYENCQSIPCECRRPSEHCFNLPCFCEFSLLHRAMSHADLSVFPWLTAVLGIPMILDTGRRGRDLPGREGGKHSISDWLCHGGARID